MADINCGHIKNLSQRTWLWVLAFLGVMLLAISVGCQGSKQGSNSFPEMLTPYMTYEVVNSFPHDPQAWTQGLVYHDGYLYESTGLYGQSSLRKVELETGTVLRQVDLPPTYFGEGLTQWEAALFLLTWREGIGLIYDLEDFTFIRDFSYSTEGWGLTHDGERLIMSDGSSSLYFLHPGNFQVLGQVEVTYQGQAVEHLNELEYIRGEVYANVWLSDDIVRIDPSTGEVKGWIDLSGLLPETQRTPEANILNGIAYDMDGDRLFVTGKFWPLLFEIRLVAAEPPD